jgi:hypothetical protein
MQNDARLVRTLCAHRVMRAPHHHPKGLLVRKFPMDCRASIEIHESAARMKMTVRG